MRRTSSVILTFILMIFCHASMAQPYGSFLCKKPGFHCYRVKRRDSWPTLFRNPDQRNLVMRLNRMNTELESGMRIAVPNDLSDTNTMDYAPLPKELPAPGEKFIYVSLNPTVLAWGAYDAQGVLQQWGPVSGGQGWCPDEHRACHTSTGRFTVYSMGGEDCVSTKFPIPRGGAPMPYCMYFHGGFALHGSHEVPGYNASHGCVRMFIPDAEWLNHDFMDRASGTTVIITKQS